MYGRFTILCGWLIAVLEAQSGEFINLDFELADTNNLVAQPVGNYLQGGGPIAELLPGWNIIWSGKSFDGIGFNLLPPEPSGFSLISKEAADAYFSVFGGGIQGDYALAFTTDESGFILSQTGHVPTGDRFLTVDWVANAPARLEERMNGVLIQNGNISGFAGQLVDLQISIFSRGSPPYVGINNISFAVPEPSRCSLFAIGLTCLIFITFQRKPADSGQGQKPDSEISEILADL